MQVSSWGARVGAFVIDVFCAGVLGACAYLLVGGLASAADLDQAGGDEAGWAVIAFLTAVAHYSPLLCARRGNRSGQTLGRQLIGTRAVCVDGTRLRYGTALVRHLCHIVITLIPLVGLTNHLLPLWDAHKQTLHDKLARTLVVKAAYEPAAVAPVSTPTRTTAADQMGG